MDTEQSVATLLTGAGHLWLRGAFEEDMIGAAREIVEREAFGETPKVTHFHGHHEDEVQLQRRGVAVRVQESASPMLRQLPGINYPYPQLLDEVEAGNTEGRYTRSRK